MPKPRKRKVPARRSKPAGDIERRLAEARASMAELLQRLPNDFGYADEPATTFQPDDKSRDA
jgi:hypothetical protein